MMRAKKVYESFSNILKPKSEDDIDIDLEEMYDKINIELLKYRIFTDPVKTKNYILANKDMIKYLIKAKIVANIYDIAAYLHHFKK